MNMTFHVSNTFLCMRHRLNSLNETTEFMYHTAKHVVTTLYYDSHVFSTPLQTTSTQITGTILHTTDGAPFAQCAGTCTRSAGTQCNYLGV